MTPTASPTPAPPPTIQWIGSDIEPSDAFVDALVALLWNVVEKRAAAAAGAGDPDQDSKEAGR